MPRLLHLIHEGTMTGAPLAAVRTAALLRPEFDAFVHTPGPVTPLFENYCRETLDRAPSTGTMNAEGFDLVICHSVATAVAVGKLIDWQRKVLWWIHEDGFFFDLVPPRLLNRCLTRADGLAFVSPHCAYRTFGHWTWLRKGRGVHVIPNWAETSARRASMDPKDGVDVVHVGSLSPTKGTDIVLRVAEATHGRGWRFHLVGKPAKGKKLPGIPANVTLHGEVAPRRVREIIAGADVLLHPSRLDNQPLVILEALASGVPAIGSELPSIDCYANERHGYRTVPVDSPDTVGLIVRRIRDLHREPARLPRAFTAAHHRAAAMEAVFSVLEMTDRGG